MAGSGLEVESGLVESGLEGSELAALGLAESGLGGLASAEEWGLEASVWEPGHCCMDLRA